jgi:hypothetical protein
VTAAPLATTHTLALGFARSRELLVVADLAEASRLYRAACERHAAETGRGASTMRQGFVYDVTSGNPRRIARISWNGRVWPLREMSSEKPLYDPYAKVGGA